MDCGLLPATKPTITSSKTCFAVTISSRVPCIFQYVFDVHADEDDVMISLEQEDMRIYREDGKENLTIGFAVHKVSSFNIIFLHSIPE